MTQFNSLLFTTRSTYMINVNVLLSLSILSLPHGTEQKEKIHNSLHKRSSTDFFKQFSTSSRRKAFLVDWMLRNLLHSQATVWQEPADTCSGDPSGVFPLESSPLTSIKGRTKSNAAFRVPCAHMSSMFKKQRHHLHITESWSARLHRVRGENERFC